MDRELLERARKIEDEIKDLERAVLTLCNNAIPESNLQIKVNTCYGDTCGIYTNLYDFNGALARRIFDAAIGIIQQRIADLKGELEEL